MSALPMRALTQQFLAWVADRPRTYAAAMEAWRSTCPRLSIWEDALDAELVRLEAGVGGLSECIVVLTPRGHALLTSAAQPAPGRQRVPPQPAEPMPAP
jgi:hypothetical protein